MNFPNYETFDNIDKAYLDFSNKFSNVINKIAPFREKRIKNSNQDWFDREISNAIFLRNKSLNSLKKTRLVPHEQLYKYSKYFAMKVIKKKKKTFCQNKLKEKHRQTKGIMENSKKSGFTT